MYLTELPLKANLSCDERPEGLNNEGLYTFVKEGLEYALKLNHNEDTLSDIQVLGFND